MTVTFNEWYLSKGDWYNDRTAQLRDAWESMEDEGVSNETIVKVFDTLFAVMSAEYGD